MNPWWVPGEDDLDVQPYPEHYDPEPWEPQDEDPPRGRVLPFATAPERPPIETAHGVYHGLTAAELMLLPDPRWLIEPYLQEGAFVLLYSDSGVGKSFVALEWALGIATGVLGLGQLHGRGMVAYIAAEGVGGYKKRVKAWQRDREVDAVEGIRFYRAAYNLMNPVVVRDLTQALGVLPEKPRLVVIDTFARCAPGADENAAQDMGVFVQHADQIRAALGCAVLVIHHAGRDKSHERGSTALRAAADIVFSLERKGAQIALTCQKQKDYDESPTQTFVLRVVPLEDGETSCVVDTGGRVGPKVTPSGLKLLTALAEQFPAETPMVTELMTAVAMSKATFYRHLRPLEEAGFITPDSSLKGVVRLGLTDLGFRTVGLDPQVVLEVSAQVVEE